MRGQGVRTRGGRSAAGPQRRGSTTRNDKDDVNPQDHPARPAPKMDQKTRDTAEKAHPPAQALPIHQIQPQSAPSNSPRFAEDPDLARTDSMAQEINPAGESSPRRSGRSNKWVSGQTPSHLSSRSQSTRTLSASKSSISNPPTTRMGEKPPFRGRGNETNSHYPGIPRCDVTIKPGVRPQAYRLMNELVTDKKPQRQAQKSTEVSRHTAAAVGADQDRGARGGDPGPSGARSNVPTPMEPSRLDRSNSSEPSRSMSEVVNVEDLPPSLTRPISPREPDRSASANRSGAEGPSRAEVAVLTRPGGVSGHQGKSRPSARDGEQAHRTGLLQRTADGAIGEIQSQRPVCTDLASVDHLSYSSFQASGPQLGPVVPPSQGHSAGASPVGSGMGGYSNHPAFPPAGPSPLGIYPSASLTTQEHSRTLPGSGMTNTHLAATPLATPPLAGPPAVLFPPVLGVPVGGSLPISHPSFSPPLLSAPNHAPNQPLHPSQLPSNPYVDPIFGPVCSPSHHDGHGTPLDARRLRVWKDVPIGRQQSNATPTGARPPLPPGDTEPSLRPLPDTTTIPPPHANPHQLSLQAAASIMPTASSIGIHSPTMNLREASARSSGARSSDALHGAGFHGQNPLLQASQENHLAPFGQPGSRSGSRDPRLPRAAQAHDPSPPRDAASAHPSLARVTESEWPAYPPCRNLFIEWLHREEMAGLVQLQRCRDELERQFPGKRWSGLVSRNATHDPLPTDPRHTTVQKLRYQHAELTNRITGHQRQLRAVDPSVDESMFLDENRGYHSVVKIVWDQTRRDLGKRLHILNAYVNAKQWEIARRGDSCGLDLIAQCKVLVDVFRAKLEQTGHNEYATLDAARNLSDRDLVLLHRLNYPNERASVQAADIFLTSAQRTTYRSWLVAWSMDGPSRATAFPPLPVLGNRSDPPRRESARYLSPPLHAPAAAVAAATAIPSTGQISAAAPARAVQATPNSLSDIPEAMEAARAPPKIPRRKRSKATPEPTLASRATDSRLIGRVRERQPSQRAIDAAAADSGSDEGRKRRRRPAGSTPRQSGSKRLPRRRSSSGRFRLSDSKTESSDPASSARLLNSTQPPLRGLQNPTEGSSGDNTVARQTSVSSRRKTKTPSRAPV